MQSVSSDYFDYYFGWENSRLVCAAPTGLAPGRMHDNLAADMSE